MNNPVSTEQFKLKHLLVSVSFVTIAAWLFSAGGTRAISDQFAFAAGVLALFAALGALFHRTLETTLIGFALLLAAYAILILGGSLP